MPEVWKEIRDLTQADIEGFDAVVHLAALSNDPVGNLDPDLTYEINHVASVRLAELAKEAGAKRFLFSSSLSAYRPARGATRDEAAPPQPLNAYYRSLRLRATRFSPPAAKNCNPRFLKKSTSY